MLLLRYQLNTLFQEINTDGNSYICKNELDAFVKEKKNRIVTIWKKCLQSFDFLSSWIWFVGSASYLVTAHMPHNGAVTTLFYQVSIAFLINIIVDNNQTDLVI